MGQGKRLERVQEAIKVELAQLILNDLKDPRLGFVTVLGVEVTPDLREAKVFVSVMGSEREKKSTLIALNHARGYLQHIIADNLRLKFTPVLTFKLDESIDYSLRIEEVLKQIHDEESDGSAPVEEKEDV